MFQKVIIFTAVICSATTQLQAQSAKPKPKTQTKPGVKKVATSTIKQAKTPAKDNGGYTKFDNVVRYKIFNKGTGPVLAAGNIAMIHMGKQIGDSVFSTTRTTAMDGVPQPVEAPVDSKDFSTIVIQLRAGDSLVMSFNPDSVFAQSEPPPFYKKGDEVLQTIAIEKIYKDKEAYEEVQAQFAKQQTAKERTTIEAYAKKNNLTLQTTEYGCYYAVQTPGTGAFPRTLDELTMNYTGSNLDGKVFDSNVDPNFQHVEPFKFTLGTGSVIPGWDDALRKFNKGAKGVLLIPSALGYGAQGSPPSIAPYSILRFDVELVDFSPAPDAAEPMPPTIEVPAKDIVPSGR
jgi:FKBP-type peptidyl-prolyl cis-trans isomerase FkpA